MPSTLAPEAGPWVTHGGTPGGTGKLERQPGALGEITHRARLPHQCRVLPAMVLTRDAVLHLMRYRSTPICATCLGMLLRVPYQRAFDAILDIEVRRELTVRPGACGGCGKHHAVVWPDPTR